MEHPNSIILMILLQVLLIGLNALFACAEIAIISMNDNKLAKMAADGDKRAIKLSKLTEDSARFLATIQVAITLAGFMGSAFAAENFSEMIVEALGNIGVTIPESIAVVVITLVLSYFTLVFGELVPKQIAMRKAEPIALGLSGLVLSISKIFRPLVGLLTLSTNGILKLFGIDPSVEPENVSEEEIRMMVDVGTENGTIDDEEREFIQNIFEFDDISADEIYTHRTDVDMLDINDSPDVWKEIIYTTRHSLYPICDDSADNIIGILNAKDYFRLEDKSIDSIMENAVKPPYFVPSSVKADILFKNMKQGRHSLAIVMDEYGGMDGIVTINDLVEQLVGELAKEEDEIEELPIKKISEDTWEIQGTAFLEDISEELGVKLSDEEYDTLNGLVFHELGTIPEDGSDIEIDVPGLHISSKNIVNHQLESAIVTLVPVVDTAEEED